MKQNAGESRQSFIERALSNIVTAKDCTAVESVLTLIYGKLIRVIPEKVWFILAEDLGHSQGSTRVDLWGKKFNGFLIDSNGTKLNSLEYKEGTVVKEYVLNIGMPVAYGYNHIAVTYGDKARLLFRVDSLLEKGMYNCLCAGDYIELLLLADNTTIPEVVELGGGALAVQSVSDKAKFDYSRGFLNYESPTYKEYSMWGIIGPRNELIAPFIYSFIMAEQISNTQSLLKMNVSKTINIEPLNGYKLNPSCGTVIENNRVRKLFSIDHQKEKYNSIVCVGYKVNNTGDTLGLKKLKSFEDFECDLLIMLNRNAHMIVQVGNKSMRISCPMIYNNWNISLAFTLDNLIDYKKPEAERYKQLYSQITPYNEFEANGVGSQNFPTHYLVNSLYTENRKKGLLSLDGTEHIKPGIYNSFTRIGRTNLYKLTYENMEGIWDIKGQRWVQNIREGLHYIKKSKNSLVYWSLVVNGVELYLGNDGLLYRNLSEAFTLGRISSGLSEYLKNKIGTPMIYINNYGLEGVYTSDFKLVQSIKLDSLNCIGTDGIELIHSNKVV